MSTTDLKPHRFAEQFPLITGRQFDELVASIAADGLLQPIIIFQDRILDGRNRYRALQALGVEIDRKVHTRTFGGTIAEALRYVSGLNLARRHLSTSQRAMAAASISTLANGERRDSQPDKNAVTVDEAASAYAVSPAAVKQARKVGRLAEQNIQRMVNAGELTLRSAELIASLPIVEQKKLRTLDQARAAADQIRHSRRRFATMPANRLVETIGVVLQEPAARGLTEFVGELGPDALPALEAAQWDLQALITEVRNHAESRPMEAA